MPVPADVIRLGNLRGPRGLQGPAGTFEDATGETIPADQPIDIQLYGDRRQFVHFKLPRGLSGVNAVENDTAVAEYIEAEGSEVYEALRRRFGSADFAQKVSAVDGRAIAQMRASAARSAESVGSVPANPILHTVNGQNARVYLPTGYRKNYAIPFVMMFHGAGETDVLNSEQTAFVNAVNAAGYAVTSCAYHGNAYGSADVMADYAALFSLITKTYAVNGIVILGDSMGGVAALNVIQRVVAGGVLGVYLTRPVYNLRNRWDNGRQSDIRPAYGIAADGSDYATKTAGYDPALEPLWKFRSLPFHIRTSPSDTQVVPSIHGLKLAAALAPYSVVTTSEASGPHGDPSHYATAPFLTFMKGIADGLALPAKAASRITSDTFAGDTTALNGRATDIRLGGTAYTWNTGNGAPRVDIVGGKLTQPAGAGALAARLPISTPNITVSAVIENLTAASVFIDVRRANTTGGDTTSSLRVEVNTSGVRLVRRDSAGTVSPLTTYVPFASGQRVGIQCIDSALTLLIDGVAVDTAQTTLVPTGPTIALAWGSSGMPTTFDDLIVDAN